MFARKTVPSYLFWTFNKVAETATKELKLIHLFSIFKHEDVIFHFLI